MLKLRADYSKKVDCQYSVYVSFNYNPFYVNFMKGLKYRSYDPNTKEWEVGQQSYDEMMNMIEFNDILYNYEDFRRSVDY